MAIGMSISVNGLDTVLTNINVSGQKATDAVNQGIQQAAKTTYQVSQTLCPVDKGDLKASGAVDFPDLLSATITYGTDHCWYVELGTCKMAAQPYLYPAFLYACQNLQTDLLLKLAHL